MSPGGSTFPSNQSALSLEHEAIRLNGRLSAVARVSMKRDLYTEVSERIVAELERGATPWVKPWSATPGQNVPQNAVSGRTYSGTNVILLWLARDRGWTAPRFLTFKQALEAGGNVRKGEHGTKVIFVKQLQVKDR